ncbi:MAG: BglG family transcription antiterminator [Anaerostipes sp.]|nr:BglG family transcription antiterminator [Anaerostipes sp.]
MAIIYNLDVRCYEILEQLLYTDEYMSVAQIADERGMSKRSVYYDIQKINEWLEAQELPLLEIERKKGIFIDKTEKELIRKNIKEMPAKLVYAFSPTERIRIIICSILQRSRQLHIDDFIELCQVSRNTTINDIKEATRAIAEFQLQLSYETGKGYCIHGDFKTKRTVFFLYFNSLSDFYKKGALPLDHPERVNSILNRLKIIEEKLQAQYVTGILYSIAVFFSTIKNRTQTTEFSEDTIQEIASTTEYRLVQEIFHEFNENEKLYLALHLLGSRTQSLSIEFMQDDTGTETLCLAKVLVRAFSRIACITFEKEEELTQAITAHLKTSLYRYRYGVQLGNPMLDDIKNEYGDLFEITRNAVKYLEKEIGVPIPDGEIAYITLHFGAYISSGERQTEEKLKVLVVCPNGLSTANMIRKEILTLVPNIQIVDNIPLSEYKKEHGYSVVISTIVIEEEENLIIVHPILTDSDRISILKKCMKYQSQNAINIMQITDIAKKYIPEQKIKAFKDELVKYFSGLSLDSYIKQNDYGQGICQVLDKRHIQIVEESMDWKQCVQIASRSLLAEGYIGKSYIENIIEKTKKYGSYMFITEEVVLLHSEIQDGSYQLGISCSIFKEPVVFLKRDGGERRAKIALVLSAENQVSHLKILNDIMTIFKEEKNTNIIWKCNSEESVKNNIRKMIEEDI